MVTHLAQDRSDSAKPDEAQGSISEDETAKSRPIPLAPLHALVSPGDLPGKREDQCQRVLGGTYRVRCRDMEYCNAEARRSVDVDVVDSDSRSADDPESWHLAQTVSVHFGSRAYDQSFSSSATGHRREPQSPST